MVHLWSTSKTAANHKHKNTKIYFSILYFNTTILDINKMSHSIQTRRFKTSLRFELSTVKVSFLATYAKMIELSL